MSKSKVFENTFSLTYCESVIVSRIIHPKAMDKKL